LTFIEQSNKNDKSVTNRLSKNGLFLWVQFDSPPDIKGRIENPRFRKELNDPKTNRLADAA
jgi:hypothetical protein